MIETEVAREYAELPVDGFLQADDRIMLRAEISVFEPFSHHGPFRAGLIPVPDNDFPFENFIIKKMMLRRDLMPAAGAEFFRNERFNISLRSARQSMKMTWAGRFFFVTEDIT